VTDRPMDTAEAASVLGLAIPTLEKMRVYGTGPKFYKLGRAVRYAAADLEDWLSERRVQSTSELRPSDRCGDIL
jgi:predicted DNA-binding transcriptional regulator AlpA